MLSLAALPLPARMHGTGRLTGSLESTSVYQLPDLPRGISAYSWGSHNYLKLDWSGKALAAGIQAEYYPQLLPGFPSELKGAGITGLYASWISPAVEATAGTFYEQFGSGLILRNWEDRELGVNNVMAGGRLALRTPSRFLSLKLLGGVPLYGLRPFSSVFVSGGDLSLDLLSLDGISSGASLALEGSLVDRYSRETAGDILMLAAKGGFEVPAHILSWSARIRCSYAGFSLRGEYAAKGQDFYMQRLQGMREIPLSRQGSALMLEMNYARGTFSGTFTLRRLENMAHRIFHASRSTSSANTLNYLPSLCMQQTYMLASLNPYETYADGEAGFQGDIYYTFRRGTLPGGKYGMRIHLGGSWINALPSALPDRETPSLAYRDINIEVDRKWSRQLKTILFVSIQENSPTHGNGKRTDAQNVFVLDALYTFAGSASMRTELQYLYSQELSRDWMAALLEISPIPHFSFSVSDMYNHGDSHLHYYNIGASYTRNAMTLSLNAGRTREGMICSGGVCRWQPGYKGFCLRFQWSF